MAIDTGYMYSPPSMDEMDIGKRLAMVGIRTHNERGEVMSYGVGGLISFTNGSKLEVIKKYAIREDLDRYIVLIPLAGLTTSNFNIRTKEHKVYVEFVENMERNTFVKNKDTGKLHHIYEESNKNSYFENNFDCLQYKNFEISFDKKVNLSSIVTNFSNGLLSLKIPKFEQSKLVKID